MTTGLRKDSRTALAGDHLLYTKCTAALKLDIEDVPKYPSPIFRERSRLKLLSRTLTRFPGQFRLCSAFAAGMVGVVRVAFL